MLIENTIFRGFSRCNVKPSYYSTFNLSLFVRSVALCLSKAPFVVCTAAAFHLVKIIRIPLLYAILRV